MIISIMFANNGGTVQPIFEIGELLSVIRPVSYGCPSFSLLPIDVKMKIDLLSVSSHKLRPKGTGFICEKRHKNLAEFIRRRTGTKTAGR